MLHGQKGLDILLANCSLFKRRVDGPVVRTMAGTLMDCALTTAGVTTTATVTAHATTQPGVANAQTISGDHTASWRRFRVQDVENMVAALVRCSLIPVTAPTATLAPTAKLTLAEDVVSTDHALWVPQPACALMAIPEYSVTCPLILTVWAT